MHTVAQVVTSDRPNRRRLVERIAHPDLPGGLDELACELVRDLSLEDERLAARQT